MMVYEASKVKRNRRTNLELNALDEAIITVLSEEHPATLRSVYYRMVSAGEVDKTEAAYQLIGRQVLKLRRAGRLPYDWITDGTRYVIAPRTWPSMEDMLIESQWTYRRFLWMDQQVSVQFFTEKDAITGVISDVCYEYHVPLGVLRGYASESFTWESAKALESDRPNYIYQLGDHDPSGVDAWRSFTEKVQAFAPDREVYFQRIAVTPDQIDAWGLPTRPTKTTDSRARQFRGESVEVDAIPPHQLRHIVRDAIEQHIDVTQLENTRLVEAMERNTLSTMIDRLEGR